MTNYEIVKKLIGDIIPKGDASIDEKILENLKAMIELHAEIHFAIDAVANDFRNDKQSSVVKCCEEANKYIDSLAECEHPYASILGDGEMSPAKCLKCGKILSA